MVVHSGTKYLGGHADLVMGFIITNNKELYDKIYFFGFAIGPIPSPFDCYLVLRSLKTLKVRMHAINDNAQKVAEYLESRKDVVERVIYPGLKSHPHYQIAWKQSTGNAGIVTFILKNGTLEDSRRFLKQVKIFILAESLGGCESLAEVPALMTHASVPPEHWVKVGIKDGLIRLAIGLEEFEDLKKDLDQALNIVKSHKKK